MIPAADIITVAPVGRIAPATPAEAVADARQQEFQRALAGMVGRSLPATVLARLTDGSFLVKVAGTQARMALPANPQPGAELPLTLVALAPRPTFQLSSAPQSAAITAFVDIDPAPLPGTNAAGQAGAMQRAASLFAGASAAHHLSDAGPAASHSTLSAAAREISSVLAVAARAGPAQTAIVAPLPLIDGAPADPARLGAALKSAIDASGLFYESHVAEWSAGKRPLADLLREPQMQRQQDRASAAQTPAARDSGAAAPGLAPLSTAAADPAVAQFINLQLASQEQGRIVWQGQAWPGQQMAWEISRDAPEAGAHAGRDGAPQDPPWRSALKLRFASLGEIGATVVLAGERLHIELHTDSQQVGELLRSRAAELQGALEASGTALSSLTVGPGGRTW
jgi:hypothetical protein